MIRLCLIIKKLPQKLMNQKKFIWKLFQNIQNLLTEYSLMQIARYELLTEKLKVILHLMQCIMSLLHIQRGQWKNIFLMIMNLIFLKNYANFMRKKTMVCMDIKEKCLFVLLLPTILLAETQEALLLMRMEILQD